MTLCDQYATLWPASEQATSAAVCMAESHGDPNAHCLNCGGVPEDSRGLYQVNVLANSQYAGRDLYDPQQGAQAGLEVWQSQGWGAWSTYKNGAYRAFLGDGVAPAADATILGQPVTSVGVLLMALAVAAWLLNDS